MALDELTIKVAVEAQQAKDALRGIERSFSDVTAANDRARAATERSAEAAARAQLSWAQAGAAITVAAGATVMLTRSVIAGAAAHEANERALRMLGGAYADVSRQTQGAFTAAEALRAQQGLVQSGLQLSGAELGSVTRAAREYALATGTEATQALEQLTDALRNGEAGGLRRFGVTLEANTTRSQSFRSALTQLETQQRGMAPAAQTLAEANADLGRTWDQMTSSLAGSIAQWTNLRDRIQSVSALIAEVRENGTGAFTMDTAASRDNARGRDTAEARLGRSNGWNNAWNRARGRIGGTEGIEYARASLDFPAARMTELTRRLDSATTVEELRAIANESRGARDTGTAARVQAAENAASTEAMARDSRDKANSRGNAPASPHSAGGTHTREPSKADLEAAFALQLMIAADEAQEAKAAAMAAFVRQQTIAADEADQAKGHNALASERANMISAADAQEEMRLASQAKGVTFAAAENDNARRENVGAQFRDAFLPAAMETQTAAERMAEGVNGAFQTMTGAMRGHIGAVIEGRETIGEALRGIMHETLLALAQEAAAKSLMSLAGGIAASVTPGGQGTAAGLFAASAIYAGVAGLAGLGAMATAAPSAAPAASAGRTPPAAASAGGSSRGGGEGSTVVINVNGTVMDREGTADSIRELLNDSLSRGGTLRAAA